MLGSVASRIREVEVPISRYIPYSHHVTPQIIATKGGEYLSTWSIGGRSHQTASHEEQEWWVREQNNVWRTLCDSGVAFWSHIIRRRVQENSKSSFDSYFCRRLDERYRASLNGCRFMVAELFLTPVVRTVGDEVLEFLGRGEGATADTRRKRQADGIAKLEELNQALRSTLSAYDAELLELYEGEGGHVFSAPLEVLARLVNGEQLPIPICRERFAEYMAQNRVLFSRHGEIGEIRTPNRVRRFGMLELFDYDGEGTNPWDLDDLLKADYEYVLTQSFSPLSKMSAKGFLERHKKWLTETEDAGVSQIEAIDKALDALVAGRFVMGEHHATLLIYGETAEEVRDYLSKARTVLANTGLVWKPVDLALEAGFWAQLPAGWKYRPRPAPITTENYLSFSPFHNFMSGKPTGNPWGPAVTVFKTDSGTPLHFSFHASPGGKDCTGQRLLGNTLAFGQSSAGKTVLGAFLLAQAQKFRPRVMAIDKDRGLEIVIRAMGGRYLPMKVGVPTGLNPLQLLPTPQNLQWQKQMVKYMAAAGGNTVTHGDEEEIDFAVNTVMRHVDPQDRRLSVLVQSLPDPVSNERDGRPTVAARLRRWCGDGNYGWLFDNPHDQLDLTTHRVYGFDITEFLKDPILSEAVLRYLLHRDDEMLRDGEPYIRWMDEAWRALKDPHFVEEIEDGERTVRKKNGLYLLMTQEPHAAVNSAIGKTLIQQCATFVLLPNPQADKEDYLEGLKLTQTEFDLVREFPESSRLFLVKQGKQSAIAKLDLAGLDEELLVMSGTPDRARMVEEIVSEVGDDPEKWLPVFWSRMKGGA